MRRSLSLPRPRIVTLTLLTLTVASALGAQGGPTGAPEPPGGGADTLPLTPTRTVRFTTDEGTWMSLDVSPDGKTIVFDLVGDLYTLPIGGGKATRLTQGMSFDGQPRYSPDGKTILFVSDRNGSENLWLIDADGKNPRPITKGAKAQYVSPEWSPDGDYIAVSKSANGILGSTYDLVLIHKDGGAGVKLTGPGTSAAPPAPPGPLNPPPYDNYLGAAFGSDGRYIYAAAKRGRFGYNLRLASAESWQIAVYDRHTGKTFLRTKAVGSGMRPALSPDGKYLAYATRLDTATALKLRELASGDETWLAPAIQRDDMESRYTRDLLPGYAFTPDSKAIVLSYGGRFWRLDVPSGRATPIPFTADVEQGLGPSTRVAYDVNDSTLTVKQIRNARPSPDGKRLAFTALDKLWVMDLPNGKPRRLTTSQMGEHSPAWSPDGRYVAYVTWTEEGGDVYRVRVGDRAARPERLTRERAFYEQLNYTPDGRRLVVARGPRQQRVERENEFEGPGPQVVELVWLPAAGGATTPITPLSFYGRPHFTRDTSRVFIYDPADGLVSMRFDGTDRKTVVKITGYLSPGAPPEERPNPANEILISPDGTRAVADVDNKVYIVAVPTSGGQTPTISVTDPAAAPVPVRRATRIGGDFLGWMGDGRRFHYSLGHSFFTYDIARADSLVRDSTMRADSLKKAKADTTRAGARGADSARVDTAQAGRPPAGQVAVAGRDSARVAGADTAKRAKPAYEPDRVDVLISVPRDRPQGTVVLRGARIVTMKGNDVIDRGDVVVTNNRIAAVGATGTVNAPAGARVIDVTGKTIIPGWVDIHAHMWPLWGVHRTQVYEYLANLAYGVTTTRDPQTSTTDVLSYGDLVETGEMLGPRIFSTGPGVFWSDDISSLDDARDVLRRYSDFYNTSTIKQYLVGDRKVRQWVVMASKELGLTPTLEGGLDFKKNLTEAIDGYAGSEHSYPITPLYNDAVRVLAASGITYTPTLLVAYGGPWAENYFYERNDIHDDPKLRRFTPHTEIDRRVLRREGWFREDQYSFPRLAAQAAKIVAAGGRVGLGGHGQLQGLGVHWELWAIASGGMPNHDVLRVGTVFGAEAIGLGDDLGSIEAGKLADLQVLDANPLDDIRNTNTVRYVMKNGRLYEAETLKEIWPRQREAPRGWWQEQGPAVAADGSR
jgi:Tol biopolymer transport system component